MRKIYTDDLLRSLYQETTAEENNDISVALLENEELMNEFESLRDTIAQLDSLCLEPHPTSIKIIMEESRKQSEQFV